MADFALCMKCGKKYEKTDYIWHELRSSRAMCRNEDCQGNICRTDAWGYPIADKLRKKGYPLFHCFSSTHGQDGICGLVFWGVNLNKQLEVLGSSPTYRSGGDDGTVRHYHFQWNLQAGSKAELKQRMLLRREEMLKQIEQILPYEEE